MNPCEECRLEDKIYECCGRFPETGETGILVMESLETRTVCPHLTGQGRCAVYEQRPLNCRSFYCLQYNNRYPPLTETWGWWTMD